MAYVTRFFMPIREISMLYNNVQSALAATERITEILDAKREVQEAKDAIELPKIKGEIEFKDLSFGYEPENFVLQDINVKINEKERQNLPCQSRCTVLRSAKRRYNC